MRGSAALRVSVAPGGVLAGPWVRDELWRRARMVPSLDLPFASYKSLADIARRGQNPLTYGLNSSSTFVGSDGLIQTAANDVPRFEHDPVTRESLGVLVEQEDTNLLLRSEEFDDANWIKAAGTSITADTATAPNGTITADTYSGTGGSGISQLVAITSGIVYTVSSYVQSAGLGNNGFRLRLSGGQSSSNFIATSNLQRFIYTVTSASTASAGCGFTRNSANAAVDAFIWGINLVANPLVTSYIPTAGSTATRQATLIDLVDSARAGAIRSFYAEFRSPAVGVRGVVSLNDGTANERISVCSDGTNIRLISHDGGAEQANIIGGTTAAGALCRVACRVGADDFAISVNGAAVVADTSGTLPTVDRIFLGRTQAGEYLNGPLARFAGWDQSLPDSALRALTC